MTITDEEVEDFLAHYGVLGMKWGVRRSPAQLARAANRREKKTARKTSRQTRNTEKTQRSVDRISRVASGEGSKVDAIIASSFQIPASDIISEFSVKGGAQATLDRNARLQTKINNGGARVTDRLNKMQGVTISNLDYSYKKDRN